MRLIKLIFITVIIFSQYSFSQKTFQELFRADSIEHTKEEINFYQGMPKDETELAVYFLKVITDSIKTDSFDEILECAFQGKDDLLDKTKSKVEEMLKSSLERHKKMLKLIENTKKDLASISEIFKRTRSTSMIGKNQIGYKNWKKQNQLDRMKSRIEFNIKNIEKMDGDITKRVIQIIQKSSQFNSKSSCPLLISKLTEKALSIYRESVYQLDFNLERAKVKLKYTQSDSLLRLMNDSLKLKSDSIFLIDKTLDILKERKKNIQEELDSSRIALISLEKELEISKNSLRGLQDTLKFTRGQLENSQVDLNDLIDTLKFTRGQLENSQVDLNDLIDTLKFTKDQFDASQTDLKYLQDTLNLTKDQLEDSQTDLKAVRYRRNFFLINFSIFFLMSVILWRSQWRLKRVKTGLEEAKDNLKGQKKQLQALLRGKLP